MATRRSQRRPRMAAFAAMGQNGGDSPTNSPAGAPNKRKRPHSATALEEDEEVEAFMDRSSAELSVKIMPLPKNDVGPAPFAMDQLAIDRRAKVDYTKKISLEEAKAGNVTRPVRVYADGIYDMFHTGHARQLMQAKMAFPHTYLIVGICSDEMTYKNKGRTVMNEAERYEAVRHCRYVDEVVTDAPWTVTLQYLEKHKIDFVAHDELPYNIGSADDVYKFVKEKGMFLATQRTEGISTTDVITRIIKDYDMYIRRNLARGYSHKELNVSYMKAKRLKLKDNYEKFESKLKDKGKDLMGKWKEQMGKGNEMLHKWEEKSKEFIGNFVDMFGKEGKLGQWFQENTAKIGRAISPTSALPLYDSPPSPSTSDPTASPPLKRSRYTPPLFTTATDDEEEEDVIEEEEEEVEEEVDHRRRRSQVVSDGDFS